MIGYLQQLRQAALFRALERADSIGETDKGRGAVHVSSITGKTTLSIQCYDLTDFTYSLSSEEHATVFIDEATATGFLYALEMTDFIAL